MKSQYLQGLDNALETANKSLYRTIHTQAGTISHNPQLDGFIAEQNLGLILELNIGLIREFILGLILPLNEGFKEALNFGLRLIGTLMIFNKVFNPSCRKTLSIARIMPIRPTYTWFVLTKPFCIEREELLHYSYY